MLCFEGHHVTTLGEITSKDGNRTEIQELESISRVVQEGKSKANDIRGQLKTLEATSNRMTSHYNKVKFFSRNKNLWLFDFLKRKISLKFDLNVHFIWEGNF